MGIKNAEKLAVGSTRNEVRGTTVLWQRSHPHRASNLDAHTHAHAHAAHVLCQREALGTR